LRPKVRPPLSQEFAEEIINPKIFVVVSPNESAIGPRFKYSRIFMMKLPYALDSNTRGCSC
jgi:hypothetical protein